MALKSRGYDTDSADGALGNKTRDALTKFQGESGLPETGRLDGRTKLAWNAVCGGAVHPFVAVEIPPPPLAPGAVLTADFWIYAPAAP